MAHHFHILDVFAERPYAGNQLAVVLDAGDLSTDEMQTIALETNFSETTFLVGDRASDGGWPVRIFTPSAELPFAGHPTIGTAWLIRNRLTAEPADEIVLNLGVGPVPVRFEGPAETDLGFMDGPGATFGAPIPAELAATALGLEAGDIDDRAPVQPVSAGIDFLFVPLRSAAALHRARLDLLPAALLGQHALGLGDRDLALEVERDLL